MTKSSHIIKAAIIDDGANREKCVSLKCSWVVKNGVVYIDRELSANSHGTTCLQIVEKYAGVTNSEWYSIRILNQETRCGNLGDFLCALNLCIKLNVQLIHLSMGSGYYSDLQPISSAVKRMTNNGIIFIAALSNIGKVTYPACFEGVIGVKGDMHLHNDEYTVLPKTFENIDFAASSIHEITRSGLPFITPAANSYAAPVITAKTLFYLYNHPFAQYDEIYSYLVKGAINLNRNDVSYFMANSETSDTTVPVVAIVGFSSMWLKNGLSSLVKVFSINDYDCRVAIVSNICTLSEYITIAPNEHLESYVKRLEYFYDCSLILLILDDKTVMRNGVLSCVDLWILNRWVAFDPLLNNQLKKYNLLFQDEDQNTEKLFLQIVTFFESIT